MYDDDVIPTGVAVGAGGVGAGLGADQLAFTGSNTLTLIALAVGAVLLGLLVLRLSSGDRTS